MLKFIKHHVDSIWGIEIFPVIAFVIFFAFFTVLLIYVFTRKKSEWSAVADLPLEESNNESLNSDKL
jgi:hypothetical protein